MNKLVPAIIVAIVAVLAVASPASAYYKTFAVTENESGFRGSEGAGFRAGEHMMNYPSSSSSKARLEMERSFNVNPTGRLSRSSSGMEHGFTHEFASGKFGKEFIRAAATTGISDNLLNYPSEDLPFSGMTSSLRSLIQGGVEKQVGLIDCSQMTVYECIQNTPRMNLFGDALEAMRSTSQKQVETSSKFNEWIEKVSTSSSEPLTVFAPTNLAFFKFTRFVKKFFSVPCTPNVAAAFLHYNALPKALSSYDIVANLTASDSNFVMLETLLDDPQYVNLNGEPQILTVKKCKDTGNLYISFGVFKAPMFTARIMFSDIQCKNGIIHVINKVLIPPLPTMTLLKLTNNSPMVANLASAKLLPLIDSYPGAVVLVPPSSHIDALNKAFLTSQTAASTGDFSSLIPLWRDHVLEKPLCWNSILTGTDLRTLGAHSLQLRVEKEEDGTKTFYIGGAKVIGCAISRNGKLVFIDRLLPIPGTLALNINSQLAPVPSM